MVSPDTRHVGVVISPLALCAVRQGGGGRDVVFRAPLDPLNGDTQWPSLTAALRDLAKGSSAGTLSIALAGTLVEVRALDLPQLREDESRSLVTRNAQRYFVGARGLQLVAIAASRKGGAGDPTIAAAAPMRLILAVHAAARDSGWTIASIVPADSAWASAACALWPAFAQRDAHLVVLQPDHTHLVHLRDGHVSGVRRFRAGVADASRIAEALRGSGNPRVGAVGSAESRKELTRVLSAAQISVSGPSAHFVEVAEQPDRLAATYAPTARDLPLRTEDMRATDRERARRFASGIGAAAVVLLLLAGVIELWGVRRALDKVAAERATLRPQLATTLVGRTSVETAYRQLATINASERTTPQWTLALVHIAQQLNSDAYLTAFRGRGDSIIVEGIADHAASVFTDLEKTRGLSRIGAAAPVRREAPSGAEPTERFTIAAHLGDAPARPAALRGTR